MLGVFCADRLGWLWADGAATLAIGGILALAAVLLLVETRGLLIGAAAEPHLIEDIIGVAGRAAFVHGVNEVRTMQLGPSDILVNLSVDARDHVAGGRGGARDRRRSRPSSGSGTRRSAGSSSRSRPARPARPRPWFSGDPSGVCC